MKMTIDLRLNIRPRPNFSISLNPRFLLLRSAITSFLASITAVLHQISHISPKSFPSNLDVKSLNLRGGGLLGDSNRLCVTTK